MNSIGKQWAEETADVQNDLCKELGQDVADLIYAKYTRLPVMCVAGVLMQLVLAYCESKGVCVFCFVRSFLQTVRPEGN